MFQIFAYQTNSDLFMKGGEFMNWTAWLWGCIVALMTGSIVAVTTVSQLPPEQLSGFQLFLITYPAIIGAFLSFLMKSPFPGSTGTSNPATVNGGAK